MSYAADHLAWQQRVSQEDNATKRFNFWRTQTGFSSQTDSFFSDWAKRNYITTNQLNHLKMLKKMHPQLFAKFAGQIHLNQKFHPNMTGKFNTEELAQFSQFTPSHSTKQKEFMMLQGPVQPKPPSFFEQAYQGKEDYRKLARARSANRPYSAYQMDDTASYMSHQKLKNKQVVVNNSNKHTIDPYNYQKLKRQGCKQKNTKGIHAEDDDWERFNEELSYKSGVSRRSHKSNHSKFSQRLRSAVGGTRKHASNMDPNQAYQQPPQKSNLTSKNLKDFEEKLSSQVAASEKHFKNDVQEVGREDVPNNADLERDLNDNEEQPEGEGDKINAEENPNEGNQDEADKKTDILPRSEYKSLSKASRRSYVESLRNELRREREKREELEKQMKEIIESQKASN